ncbi:MAG: Gp49 family protein [bacterium]|nr:Gp49 family protein [bacterium]
MNSEQETETAAAADRPTVTKLSPDDIKAKVVAEKYMFPADFGPSEPKVLTVCVLTLENGFQVVGKSACADPANFNLDLGCQLAKDDALRQVWPLEGYLLKEDLYRREQAKAA